MLAPPVQPDLTMRNANPGQTYFIFNEAHLDCIRVLRSGDEIAYTVNATQRPLERDAAITIQSKSDDGVIVAFSKAPELGDVFVPWGQADRLILTSKQVTL